MINQRRVLEDFFSLVKINCPTKGEREVTDLLKSRLNSLGLNVLEDDVATKIGGSSGNIIAYLQGTVANAPVLLLSAHLDCVEPCIGIKPQLRNGVITSDGTTILGADCKAGIVGIMEALRVVKESAIPHGDIRVILTVAEEGGGLGAKNLDQTLLKSDFSYVLDSSGVPGTITVKAPGKNKINIVVHGRTAYAGLAPEEGINAILVASKALAELKDGRIDHETTVNIGRIQGGSARNMVPDQVEIDCEVRSRSSDKLTTQTKKICKTFEKVATLNDAWTQIKISKVYAPYILGEDSNVVLVAYQAAKSIGLKPRLGESGGGTDANFFNLCGIPTAALGTGMSKIHTKEESIEEAHLYQTAELVLAIIKTVSEGDNV